MTNRVQILFEGFLVACGVDNIVRALVELKKNHHPKLAAVVDAQSLEK